MNVANVTKSESGLFPDPLLAPTAALLHAQLAVRAAIVSRAVEPLALDESTADLLVRLAKAPDGSLRGVEIAQQLVTNAARVSRLVDRAERAGLVVRESDPNDRRAQQVRLTGDGWSAARAYAPRLADVVRSITSDLTAEEQATLIDLLERLATRASDVGGT